jgi:electron transfer flavoprotein alpha subunit
MHMLDGLPAPRAALALTLLPRNEPHAGLDGARIVVSGGRGMGDDTAFPLLYDIAARLGGAVGASLPAVDAGWAPVTRQVGISGKYVSPDIYLAIGISGTPQHLAGIDPHTRIVAINKDAEANIFNVAEAGAVAEWQTLLPALLDALDSIPAP